MENRNVLIAMSGGVDSSVAAWLIQQQGFTCKGATMRLFDNHTVGAEEDSTCCSSDDVEDARSVAYRLGIPFHVFNMAQEFRQHVIDPFIQCYECGNTPNPCIECNRHLKFREFLRRAQILECDGIATGHYARIRRDEATGRYLLYKAADMGKDQSYVLYCLTQEQLSRTYLPLGALSKEQVRQIAMEQGFINAHKRDSQDICFVPDGDYVAFMKRYTSKSYASGNFLNLDGQVVGQHKGAVCYTLGQRKGLGLAMGAPVYVCGKDVKMNTVTVGPNEALFHRVLRADNWNFFPFEWPKSPIRVLAKARYRQAEQPATLYPEVGGICRVEFDEPQRAITPGQAVVLYDGDQVIGGGTITEVV